MTDLTPELGSSVSCPNCGNQVSLSAGGGGPLTCPACGTLISGGWRDQATSDLTNEELLRSLAVKGYDTDASVVEPGALRCHGCDTTAPADRWGVDDLQRASNMTEPGAPESVVAALRCPTCERMAQVELALRGPDASADDRVHAALTDRRRGTA